MNKTIVVGITGASGSIYAIRLIEELLKNHATVYVICTETGKKIINFEMNMNIEQWIADLQKSYNNLYLEDINNLFSPLASGSFPFDCMIILPCSMGTLAEISNGLAKNLLCRTADVALKENRQLIIVPRETPLNTIHLENMLTLSKMGVTILPAMPGFYHQPKTIDELVNFIIGKLLDMVGIENKLFNRWGSNM